MRRRTWLLVGLSALLVVGVVAMHSLVLRPAASMPSAGADHSHAAAMGGSTMTVAMDVGHTGGDADLGGHGEHGGGLLEGCEGLVAICLALLVGFATLLLLRERVLRRVLWQLPPPTAICLGLVRVAHQSLSPLQRTTVLRC